MRLIDADELLNDVRKSMDENPHKDVNIKLNHDTEHQHFMKLILEQLTAYDVDKVVEQIEAKQNDLPSYMFAREEDDHEGIYNNGVSDGYESAIEIIRAGAIKL